MTYQKSIVDYFIIRKKMLNFDLIESVIKERIKNHSVITIDKPTDGQARTVSLCIKDIKKIENIMMK